MRGRSREARGQDRAPLGVGEGIPLYRAVSVVFCKDEKPQLSWELQENPDRESEGKKGNYKASDWLA